MSEEKKEWNIEEGLKEIDPNPIDPNKIMEELNDNNLAAGDMGKRVKNSVYTTLWVMNDENAEELYDNVFGELGGPLSNFFKKDGDDEDIHLPIDNVTDGTYITRLKKSDSLALEMYSAEDEKIIEDMTKYFYYINIAKTTPIFLMIEAEDPDTGNYNMTIKPYLSEVTLEDVFENEDGQPEEITIPYFIKNIYVRCNRIILEDTLGTFSYIIFRENKIPVMAFNGEVVED